jgi:hypothetical protein
MSDPSGGLFDSAGDFDRLLRRRVAEPSLLNSVDLHGEMLVSCEAMPDLIAEVDLLLEQAIPGPEHRGLMRLRAMAVRCRDQHGQLLFIGD